MASVTGRLTDYGNVHDFRSVLEDRLNTKRSELGETELSLKKFIGNRLGSNAQGGVDGAERLSSFKGRLGPVVSVRGRNGQQNGERRTSIGLRLGPRVSESLEDEDESSKGGANGYGGEVTGRGSVMSRIVVEQKSREDALAEQKIDKKETQRNRRMFGSILGTLQKFRTDESKVKDRELKKRKIEAKIDQKTEQEREDAIRQKKELFEDKKRKEREIKVLQVQMKRVEEFETWERSKRKEQKYIRTKQSSTKIYFLPKHHNDATLTALEDTMDEIDKEIQAARELFEDELLKISARAENNPNASLEDLEGDDNSDDENVDSTHTKSIVSTIKKPHSDRIIKTERKDEERNEAAPPIKIQGSDQINGHSDANWEKNNVKSENPVMIKHEKVPELKLETNEFENTSIKKESNCVKAKENKQEESIERDTFNEMKESYDKPNIPTSIGDIPKNAQSFLLDNSNDDEKTVKKEELNDNTLVERSRSKSPKEKLNRSSSAGEKQPKLSKIHNQDESRQINRKRKLSSSKMDHTKKSRTSKKRKDSSDDSSTSSSSSDDKSESESDSSTADSGSSVESSSDAHSKKKKGKKGSKRTTKNKTSIYKDKQKSSIVQKRLSRKSRSQRSRKMVNKKDSDSSDSD